MTWGAVAVGGASLLGGMMAGDAAGDAADAQIAASERASAVQEAARKQQRADLMPWMQGGGQANNALLYRLGLGGSANGGGGASYKTLDQFRNELRASQGGGGLTGPNDPGWQWEGVTYGADGLPIEWLKGKPHRMVSNGSIEDYRYEPLNLPSAAPQSTVNVDAEAQKLFDQQEAQRAQFQATASSDPNYGSLLRKFDQSDLNTDLVYQNGLKFGLNTGINQLNTRAAAAGGYGSGAALKALTRFGNDYATTKTGDAYARNMGEKNQTYNFLSGQSQQGQSAAAGVGAAGISTANGIGNNIMGAGNAQAAGMVGGANALGSGIAGATDAFRWNQLLSKPTVNNYSGSSYNPSAANYENSFDRMN